ncbi:MAG: hypothetical protein HOE90_18065 [Bacteriovoracaceae bacterium]|jgi:hypothetical protein|nr:hypothetical protein [Bacteriovoracaceae bacterium]
MSWYLSRLKTSSIGISLILSSSILAGNLTAPIDMESAAVLPKGIRNVRVKGVGTKIGDKFDNDGNSVPIGNDMNSVITVERIYEGETDDVKASKTMTIATLEGIGHSDSLGNSTGMVNVGASVTVPVFAYGMSKKWTAAIAVPVTRVDQKVATGVEAGDALKKLQDAVRAQGTVEDYETFMRKTSNPIAEKAAEYGYNPITNRTETKLGDIKLVNKHQLLKRSALTMTLRNDIVLPTGKEKNIDEVVDIPAGDGQWDIGLGVIAEYKLSDFTFSGAVNYIWQTPYRLGVGGEFKDRSLMRVPRNSYSSLSPDKDMVQRDLGDQFMTQVGGKFEFFTGFHILSAYTFQYKERDKYEGSLYSDARYYYMGKNSRQKMHAVTMGAGFSTIPLFKQKKFKVPLQANLTYALPVNGKSVSDAGVAQGELVLFF